jgi:glycosyltransferase involved in cell wall biosynthesis
VSVATDRQSVSLIATVLNERRSIDQLLASIARQSHKPDEVVIADGGSNDGTREALQKAAECDASLRILTLPGSNISEGRNAAVKAAQHDVLLVTDAGVVLPDDWVERLCAVMWARPDVDMVGGFFHSAPRSTFEWALGATTLPLEDEIDPDTFMPSHRSVAYRRSAWERVGGYPEWLDYCEDLVFDMRLRELGGRIAFEPAATVEFQPRASAGAFFKQYFRYASGDGAARILLKRHAIRYAVYGSALAGGLVATRNLALAPAIALPGALLATAYCLTPWRRLVQDRSQRPTMQLLAAAALVPALRLIGDVAKMLGFPFGVVRTRAHSD